MVAKKLNTKQKRLAKESARAQPTAKDNATSSRDGKNTRKEKSGFRKTAKGAGVLFADLAGISDMKKMFAKDEPRDNPDSIENYVKKPSKSIDEALVKSAKTGKFTVVAPDKVSQPAPKVDSVDAYLRKSEKPPKKPAEKSSNRRKILSIVGWVAWFVATYFIAQIIVAIPLAIMQYAGLFDIQNPTAMAQMLIQAAIYATMLIVAVGGPWLLRKRLKLPRIRELIGLDRRPTWRDAGYALASTPVYYGLLLVASLAVTIILGVVIGTDSTKQIMEQTQEIGFSRTGNSFAQLAVIFVALVVVPPVCEEILMRGLLFGRLRRKLSYWPTAIIVSLTFAVAHWQINVAIDTFVLSMVMCYVREKTGSIWGTIGMHVIKNGIAFVLLFLVNVPGLA